ncbi:hypothetical protein SSX86_016868 [Deinandra increscens subsp. villosa]|uniref:CCR4-NOT transcription complex subunit 4 n=1 Tax=Deinandra increscens subsp. villosa TaxID=3103831 RepID=A0AAP0GTR5_9ASTR
MLCIMYDVGIMSNEEEKKCPLCAEEMDWTDQQLKPCKCGYEVCVWCWHHIMDMAEKDAEEGRCPACRTPYDKNRIVGLESSFQRVSANSSSRKQKPPKAKQKPNEGRKDLSNVRVIQRKMAYIIGLPISLADEDLLQRKNYFGQYGKVTKVSLSRTAGGTVQQFVNDTCSVYITYSKEEEAVRCIQSVHGYMLDGRFLRASFGTAKYCHTWLRNTPCNNVACLYLHSIGAEEDSFGKDEIAAVHTRNRVQEIVGATQYLHKRSGSMLPPPVDEHSNSHSASAHETIFSSGLEDVAYAAVASADHMSCSKEINGIVKPSKHRTSFVDIVGRSCNSGSDKDISSESERQMLNNLCSDMSSVCIDRSNCDKAVGSDLVSSTSNFYSSQNSTFSEASRLSVEHSDLTLEDSSITKEQSGLILGSQNSTNPAGVIKSNSDRAWWDMESRSQNGYSVNNYAESIPNNVYNEETFESFAKSDRIYGGSKSFCNEEIVEHLRRLDDDSLVNDDENSAAVESSIISNILSMDFDGCDDSGLPQTVTGLFEGKDGRHGSSWKFHNSDQSRFSFANEQGHTNEELGRFYSFQDSVENQDSTYKPQYQASRAQNVIPPGFSKPPPGFSSCMRTEQSSAPFAILLSGSYVKNSLPNHYYPMPSIGNIRSSINDDVIDPAIMAVRRGNSSSFGRRSSSLEEETKLWLLMQQQKPASATPHHHEPHTSFMQQHITPQFPSSRDNYYGGLTSRLVDTQKQYSLPKFSNGHITNGAQQAKTRSEVGSLQEQIQWNERLGLEKLRPGYGDYMFQMPSSGDLYTRVFGM